MHHNNYKKILAEVQHGAGGQVYRSAPQTGCGQVHGGFGAFAGHDARQTGGCGRSNGPYPQRTGADVHRLRPGPAGDPRRITKAASRQGGCFLFLRGGYSNTNSGFGWALRTATGGLKGWNGRHEACIITVSRDEGDDHEPHHFIRHPRPAAAGGAGTAANGRCHPPCRRHQLPGGSGQAHLLRAAVCGAG